jgi:hypothetical protein
LILRKIILSIHTEGWIATVNKITKTLLLDYKNQKNELKIRKILEIEDIEARFKAIYQNNLWGNAESVSGPGSTLVYTSKLRAALPNLIIKYNIKSIFDAPCGDLNWMGPILSKLNIHYIGGDIVEELIEVNKKKYQTSTTSFIHINLVSEAFPYADLLVCRDCLFHLCYRDTLRLLENYVDAGIPYLLVTTHKTETMFANRDITTGDYRLMDIFAAPYFFPLNPSERIDDWEIPGPAREVCLFNHEQVSIVCKKMRASLTLEKIV